MTRFSKYSVCGFACAGILLLGLAHDANATLTLRATETTGVGATLLVVDNGAGDTNSTVGIISLGDTVTPIPFGDFSVLGSISASNALLPNGPPTTIATLESSSLKVTNNSAFANSIILEISDTDYTAPPSPLLLGGTASGTFTPDSPNTSVFGSTAQARAWSDNTNALFGHQFLVQDFSFAALNQSFGQSYSNSQSQSGFSYTNPPGYSMTVQLDFTVAGKSQLDSRSDVIQAISAIPEPTTMVAALTGLPILGLGTWLRRRRA